MPDDDRFRTGLSRRWMQVKRSIGAGDHRDRTADLIVKAVASDLRRLGGLGALAARAEVAGSRGDMRWSDAILSESRVSRRHDLTLLAATELTRHLALTSPTTGIQAFAERLISSITDDRLDRMLTDFLRPGGLTAPQFAELRSELSAHPQMLKLRDLLLKHPDARGLRAPRRTVRPPAAEDLLHADLSELR